MNRTSVLQFLTAEIGDTIATQDLKGKVIGLEHMRDGGGSPQIMLLLEPSRSAKKESPAMPEGYSLTHGAQGHGLYFEGQYLGPPLEVVAEVLYPNGDKGLLLRWSLEYADPAGGKRLELGTFVIHSAMLEEDARILLGRLRRGGYTPLEKMPDEVPDLLHNYLVKSEPALKAVSISDLREHAARNGWEIPVASSGD